MDKINIPDFGEIFFKEIDSYLIKNRKKLTCANVAEIYWKFFNTSKKFKGNSEGFTGLSELIIFRYLFHQLGGSSFVRKSVSEQQFQFISENCRLGCNIPLVINDKKYKPDIVVFQSDKLIAVISVKVYFTNGFNTIADEMEKLEKFKASHPEMKALLITFASQPQKGKVLAKLREVKKSKEWFNFMYLKENNELFGKTMGKYLGLERVVRQYI